MFGESATDCFRSMTKPSTRSRRLFAVAGGLALLAVGVTLAAGPGSAGQRVLVARDGLPAGLVIDDRVVAERLVGVVLPNGAKLAGLVSAQEAIGRRTVGPIGVGEPLTSASIGGIDVQGPEPLRKAERAITVPLRAAGASAATLIAGDVVDVVATSGEGLTGRAEVVVGGAEVLAVVAATDTGDEGAVVLRTDAREALRTASALNFAREVRLLRRPESGSP